MDCFKRKFISFASIRNVKSAVHRIEVIQDIGWSLNPPLEAAVCDSGLMTQQRIVKFSHTFVQGISKNHIRSLSKQTAYFHRAGLVHGDLCRSNIGARGEKVFIFDWEPAIVLSNGILRTSPYCIHPFDLKQNTITMLTDRFAILFHIVILKFPCDDLFLLYERFKNKIVNFLEIFGSISIDCCAEKFFAYLENHFELEKGKSSQALL